MRLGHNATMKRSAWPIAVLAVSLYQFSGSSFALALVPRLEGAATPGAAKPLGGMCPSVASFSTSSNGDGPASTVLKVGIGRDGEVQSVVVARSSGFRELDAEAKYAATKCAFSAGTVDGVPTDSVLLMRYTLDLYASPTGFVAQKPAELAKPAPSQQVRAVLAAPVIAVPQVRMEDLHCSSPEPKFPMKMLDVQGFSKADVVVSMLLAAPDARVAEVKVQRSSGYHVIDEAAVAAMRTTQCKPDKPLERDMWGQRSMVFSLE